MAPLAARRGASVGRHRGLVRLTHPFPSLLDGVVVGGRRRCSPAPTRRPPLRLGVVDDRPPGRRSGRSTTSSTHPATPAASPASRSRPGSCRAGRGAGRRGRRRGRRAAPGGAVRARRLVALARRRPRDRLRLRPASRRARPGRGCRSPSGSRCCRSSAGSGPTGGVPASFAILLPVAVRRRGRPGHRQRPGRRRARRRRRRRPRSRPRSGAERSWSVDAGLLRPVVVGWPLGSLVVGRRRAARRSPAPSSRAGRRRPSGVASAGDADAARRERAWELQAVGVARAGGRLARPAMTPAEAPAPVAGSVARVVAPDDGDRVLEPELGDRQVLGQVRPIASRRSSRGRRRCAGPRRAHRRRRPGCCLALTSESSASSAGARPASADVQSPGRRGASVGVGGVVVHASVVDRRRHRPRRRRPRPRRAVRRPSILSRSLMSVSSPRATWSASRRRFFGSSTFISS